jgi:hypothetical protein
MSLQRVRQILPLQVAMDRRLSWPSTYLLRQG